MGGQHAGEDKVARQRISKVVEDVMGGVCLPRGG